MNAFARPLTRLKPSEAERQTEAISEEDVEAAIRTILLWIGEDPERDGLRETPSRLMRAFQEYFSGYRQDPALI